MEQLCATCNTIPFLSLTMPTASDILAKRALVRKGTASSDFLPFPKSVVDPRDIDLGCLSDIQKRSAHCPLCALIHSTVCHRGARYYDNRPIPANDSNVIFKATVDLRFFAYITETATDSAVTNAPGRLFIPRRLDISVTLREGVFFDSVWMEPRTLAHYGRIAQACHVRDFYEEDEEEIGKEGVGSPSQRWERQPNMLFGGRKRPEVIDPVLLRRWMAICENEHEDICHESEDTYVDGESPSYVREGMRLIDVERKCIVSAAGDKLLGAKYASLSYTWGIAKQVKLTWDNQHEMETPGAFSKIRLPQTIQDAIDLVELLGLKWIWVDALCIMQGESESDLEDKKVQLANMGNIYSGAFLTIVAASGDNADTGLSGIRPGSRLFQQRIVKIIPEDADSKHAGLSLLSTCASRPVSLMGNGFRDEDADLSAWNTRAWTFQERYLSRRCIVITPEQTYWSCDGGLFCEESFFEHPNLYEKGVFDTPLKVELWGGSVGPLHLKSLDGPVSRINMTKSIFWSTYKAAVLDYSKRQMSFRGDVHDAISAVIDAFGQLSGDQFRWGHPDSRFGNSLAWSSPGSESKLHRRTAKTTLPMTVLNRRVQLPSWSWMGWVGAVSVPVGDQQLEMETTTIMCYEHHTSPLTFMPIHGTTRFDHRSSDWTKTTFQASPTWQKDLTMVTSREIKTQLPQISESELQDIPDGHVIFFWTSSAHFTIERPLDWELEPEKRGSEYLQLPTVKDYTGRPVGNINRLGTDHWVDIEQSTGMHEFVAISRRQVPQLPDEPAIVTALQITWVKGFAERVNVAEIEEKAWIAAGPVWKLIALA
ncbi:heterokaryon incompatibility protein-domain-containing protein [Dendryphion nanum]|uniref:Heterokaryon incompatibility protein-domain-containing protein n=1 Tax=Dendryphion nanum TaxID=256645 RepID=A0A9P9DEA6_9PLEO|nr:heterokaryon incompatibility protein-domain-containing protein [Dendryphion nanum]